MEPNYTQRIKLSRPVTNENLDVQICSYLEHSSGQTIWHDKICNLVVHSLSSGWIEKTADRYIVAKWHHRDLYKEIFGIKVTPFQIPFKWSPVI